MQLSYVIARLGQATVYSWILMLGRIVNSLAFVEDNKGELLHYSLICAKTLETVKHYC